MERFFERHQSRIVGVLSGFDRVLFRGTLRSIYHLTGMELFLSSQKVLYKDFGVYVNKLSEQLKDHTAAVAQRAGRPVRYLASASARLPSAGELPVVTRFFRLLRAHGLIQKVSGRRYYRVTDKGTQVMTTALQIRETNIAQLAA